MIGSASGLSPPSLYNLLPRVCGLWNLSHYWMTHGVHLRAMLWRKNFSVAPKTDFSRYSPSFPPSLFSSLSFCFLSLFLHFLNTVRIVILKIPLFFFYYFIHMFLPWYFSSKIPPLHLACHLFFSSKLASVKLKKINSKDFFGGQRKEKKTEQRSWKHVSLSFFL
jgi:hypothetical protein